jgi:hypothetical protein
MTTTALVGIIKNGLAHVPPDSDGLWPAAPVRDLVEEFESDAFESGLRSGKINSRGPMMWSPTEGGTHDRAFAARFRAWAGGVADQPRTAAFLRLMAEGDDAWPAGKMISLGSSSTAIPEPSGTRSPSSTRMFGPNELSSSPSLLRALRPGRSPTLRRLPHHPPVQTVRTCQLPGRGALDSQTLLISSNRPLMTVPLPDLSASEAAADVRARVGSDLFVPVGPRLSIIRESAAAGGRGRHDSRTPSRRSSLAGPASSTVSSVLSR